ncbi:peroxisome biogenesis factor 10 [Malassezia pachydermatis]|uniref:RING-type E3 ubiquitin transferase n=1 Tax=Malassezia pachydermatis TaxID=77020 RepID=A0A0M8MRQ5_9BASI|nr:peroxisomal assembly protein-peroxin [Malassezia pachydermatis]KOS15437.1 peroxisomal assembly protein-peroxin [Malassezia pachydermatis]
MDRAERRRTPARLGYPRAAQAEIVRLHQKDAYYRDLFYEQLKDVATNLFGSRRTHLYEEALALIASVAYFSLSTLGGAQSLGEEYVNSMMRHRSSGRVVSVKRRAVFLSFYVLAPYVLTRAYGRARTWIVRKDQRITQQRQRAELQARMAEATGELDVAALTQRRSWKDRVEDSIQWLAATLPGSHVLSASDGWLAYASAAQLAVFYLWGRYYTIAHRLAKVDYIYASARRPGSKPLSYEVLGVLLAIQLIVKASMSLHRTWTQAQEAQKEMLEGSDAMKAAPTASRPAQAVQLDHTFIKPGDENSLSQGATLSATSVPLQYPDADVPVTPDRLGMGPIKTAADQERWDAMQASVRAKTTQLEAIAEDVLRCTLCMDRRAPEQGTSAVTECGHVFCWDCITEWAKEKAECPLCRQSLQCARLIPIYNL